MKVESPLFVIFDPDRKSELGEIALEEASRAGMRAIRFDDSEDAIAAMGFKTAGMLASFGRPNLEGRTPGLQVIYEGEILGIPRAIAAESDEMIDEIRGQYPLFNHDVIIPRHARNAQFLVREWLGDLPRVF